MKCSENFEELLKALGESVNCRFYAGLMKLNLNESGLCTIFATLDENALKAELII